MNLIILALIGLLSFTSGELINEFPFVFSIDQGSLPSDKLEHEFKEKVVVPEDCFVDQITALRIFNNSTNDEYVFGMWKCDGGVKEFPKFKKNTAIKDTDFHFKNYQRIISKNYGVNGTFHRPNSKFQTCYRSRKAVIEEAKRINKLLIKRGEDRLIQDNLILSTRIVRMAFHTNQTDCDFMMNINVFSTKVLSEEDLKILIEGNDREPSDHRLNEQYGILKPYVFYEDDYEIPHPIKLCFSTYKVSMIVPEPTDTDTLIGDLTVLFSEALDNGSGYLVIRPLNLVIEPTLSEIQTLASFNLFVTCNETIPSANSLRDTYQKYFTKNFPQIEDRVYANTIGIRKD